jgi:Integrase core domain
MRDELLAIEQFERLLEAQVLIGDWRQEYNSYRPHSALGMLTPAEFAKAMADQPTQTLIAGGPTTGSGQLPKAVAVAPVLRGGPLRLLQTGGCGHDESECTGLGIVNRL